MPAPKRILLIEDDPDYERLVRAVLAASEDAWEVESAASLASGLASIEQFAPQIILVDLNLTDSEGYQTFVRVRERAGAVPIVVLTGLDDDQTAVRAVEDGAQDYLVKSLVQPKLIARCLKMAASRQNRLAGTSAGFRCGGGKVLGFIGSKGGVGTSTIAVNVAALLAHSGLNCVLIEFQAGRPGTSSLFLEAEPQGGLNALFQKPPEEITEANLNACLSQAAYGLRLLCPGNSPGAGRALSAGYADAILKAARRAFSFVVLDLPAHLDEGVAGALDISDSITIVVDREPASVSCGRAFIQQIKGALSQTREVNLAVVDRTGLPTPVPLADIKNQIRLHPLVMIPQAASAIALSHSARTPLALLCPDEGFSRAHVELAERLLPPDVRAQRSLGGAGESSRATAWRALADAALRAIPETLYG